MLSALIWLPVLGAALIGFWPQPLTPQRSRLIAQAIAILTFLGTLFLASGFDLQIAGLQFQEQISWIAPLGLDYQLGVDGLSLPLVVLNGLLVWLAVQTTPETVARPRLFYSLLLLLGTAVTGAFVAQNLLLFFLFYELELIPLYFLIVIWGGERRGYAATKFLIYQALSGIVLLAGFLGWAWLSKSDTFALDPQSAALLPIGELTLHCGIATEVKAVRRNIKRVHLEDALLRLPVTERIIFFLSDVERYDHARIGRVLNIGQEASRQGAHQARLRMREILATLNR